MNQHTLYNLLCDHFSNICTTFKKLVKLFSFTIITRDNETLLGLSSEGIAKEREGGRFELRKKYGTEEDSSNNLRKALQGQEKEQKGSMEKEKKKITSSIRIAPTVTYNRSILEKPFFLQLVNKLHEYLSRS